MMIVLRWLYWIAVGIPTAIVILAVFAEYPEFVEAGVPAQFLMMLLWGIAMTPFVLLDRKLFWRHVYGDE